MLLQTLTLFLALLAPYSSQVFLRLSIALALIFKIFSPWFNTSFSVLVEEAVSIRLVRSISQRSSWLNSDLFESEISSVREQFSFDSSSAFEIGTPSAIKSSYYAFCLLLRVEWIGCFSKVLYGMITKFFTLSWVRFVFIVKNGSCIRCLKVLLLLSSIPSGA